VLDVSAAARPTAPSPHPAAVIQLLRAGLARTLRPEAMAWLDAELDRQRNVLDDRRLAIALGLLGRKVARSDLSLSDSELAAARELRAGWQPERWGTDEAARVAILLATYRGDDQAFAARVDRLCATAGVAELVASLKGFAVFPAAAALQARAREGVRASMRPPFDAIACHNPYPFDYFDAAAWNQMVVKCVFVGAPIESIVGLRERRNPDVVQMLRDLISERNAAGRRLPEEVHGYVAGAARDNPTGKPKPALAAGDGGAS
jgi:hypothetical protein